MVRYNAVGFNMISGLWPRLCGPELGQRPRTRARNCWAETGPEMSPNSRCEKPEFWDRNFWTEFLDRNLLGPEFWEINFGPSPWGSKWVARNLFW